VEKYKLRRAIQKNLLLLQCLGNLTVCTTLTELPQFLHIISRIMGMRS